MPERDPPDAPASAPTSSTRRATTRALTFAAALLVHAPVFALIWMRDVSAPPPAPGMQAILVDIVKDETPKAKSPEPPTAPKPEAKSEPQAKPEPQKPPVTPTPAPPKPLATHPRPQAPARAAAQATAPAPSESPKPASLASAEAPKPGGVAPAGASDAGIGTATAPTTYLDHLKSWLAAHKQYPKAARRMRIEGDAVLWFKLDRTGHVVAHRLEKKSGSEILDREVEAMLQRADPLPAPPDKIPEAALEYRFPIRFHIDSDF